MRVPPAVLALLLALPAAAAEAPASGAGAVAAQPAPEPKGRPRAKGPARPLGMPSLQALDLNGDGAVTRDEYQVGKRAFDRHDTDKDGVVKLSEVPAGAGPGAGADPLRRMDLDGNGEVTRDEAQRWRDQQFDRLDANSDGRLTPDEGMPGQGPRGLGALDKDGDGAISSDEFSGDASLVDRHDTDGDGRLRPGDLPAGPTPERAKERFDRLDANHDGVVTREEVVDSRRQLFKTLDTNGDGRLDAAEIAKAQAARQRD